MALSFTGTAPGVMLLEIPVRRRLPPLDGPSAGLGSNDIGLDRQGKRHERVAVHGSARCSCKQSVISIEWRRPARAQVGGGLVRALDTVGIRRRRWAGGRVLVDATGFLLRDRGRPTLAAGQLSSIGPERLLPAQYSRFRKHRGGCHADVRQRHGRCPGAATRQPSPGATADRHGRRRRWRGGAAASCGSVAGVAPSADAVTCASTSHRRTARQQLPAARRRPRAGTAAGYVDATGGHRRSMVVRYIRKHRLEEEKDPNAAVSDR